MLLVVVLLFLLLSVPPYPANMERCVARRATKFSGRSPSCAHKKQKTFFFRQRASWKKLTRKKNDTIHLKSRGNFVSEINIIEGWA